MTCKDCIHYEACKDWINETALQKYVEDNGCDKFKDKSRFIESPCKVGETFYFVIDTSRFGYQIKPRICKGVVQELALSLKNEYEKLTIVVKLSFSPIRLEDFGDTEDFQFRSFSLDDFISHSYSTKEQAEQTLKEREKNG